MLAASRAACTCTPRMLCTTRRDRQRSWTSRLSGKNSKSRSITRAKRSVSAMLQPKPIFVARAGGGIPVLTERLGGVAKSGPASKQRQNRSGDHCVLEFVALAHSQKNVAVQQTGTTVRH